MPHIDIDLSNIPESELLQPGWYNTRIVSVDEKATRAGDKRMFVFELEIDPDRAAFEGQSVMYFLVYTSGRGRIELNKLCQQCGINVSNGIDTEDFLGCELEVEIEHRVPEGETEPRNSVKRWR